MRSTRFHKYAEQRVSRPRPKHKQHTLRSFRTNPFRAEKAQR